MLYDVCFGWSLHFWFESDPFPGSSSQTPASHLRKKDIVPLLASRPVLQSTGLTAKRVKEPAVQANKRPRQRPGLERNRPRPPTRAEAETHAGSAVLGDGVGSRSSSSRALSAAEAWPRGRGRGKTRRRRQEAEEEIRSASKTSGV